MLEHRILLTLCCRMLHTAIRTMKLKAVLEDTLQAYLSTRYIRNLTVVTKNCLEEALQLKTGVVMHASMHLKTRKRPTADVCYAN